MVVFISGQMSGLPNHNRAAFFEAEAKMKEKGYTVLNPAILPDGLHDDKAYIAIDTAMLMQADAIYMLPGWENSRGARIEYDIALRSGITCLNRMELDWGGDDSK